jgi:flagellar biosynthesis GTPase FlhF
MEASTSNDPDVKTFRGRSLEEILPQIREELGPDAIVLRRREGLTGGVGGFFQRPYVEVDARGPLGDERALEIRNDRATAEGLSSPAVQALFEQATPFADALAAAAHGTSPQNDFFSATVSEDRRLEPPRGEAPVSFEEDFFDPANISGPTGLYGPQPNQEAIRRAAPTPPPVPDLVPPPEPEVGAEPVVAPTQAKPEPEPEPTPEPEPEPEPVLEADEPEEEQDAPAPVFTFDAPTGFAIPRAPRPAGRAGAGSEPLLPDRPQAADAAEQRLIAAGLSQPLAADIVREAVVHGLPFTSPRNIKKLVRNVLAGRIDVFRELGTEPRTIALVGGGGAGKTSTVAYIAASYVSVGADVAVISLRGDTTLAARLQPLGVAVIQAKDGEQAKKRLGAARPLITLIDTPAVGLSSTPGEIKELAAELKLLEVNEVHLALPATLSAAAADELSEALAPLSATHVVLSHADETKRPGAPIELALKAGLPLSYICARSGVTPADPAELAAQLLP